MSPADPGADDGRLLDALVIGAGPTGLACGIELKKRGLETALVDQGCVVNSLYSYPTNLVFFTTPELLEIGDLPMTSMGEKPVRAEALKYYRRAAAHYRLDIRSYQRVTAVEGRQGDFLVESRSPDGRVRFHRARTVVAATGFYDIPVLLGVPGEDLPKVHHYYKEAHPFFGLNVAVVGGANSAVIAALDLVRSGARVTLIHRGPEIDPKVKYWLRPDMLNRIRDGAIGARFGTRVTAIRGDEIDLATPEGPVTLPNDVVLALTGYSPDFPFLESIGVGIDHEAGRPRLDPGTYETGRPGLFLAGVVVAGVHTSEIFIENGRFHGAAIAEAIAQRLAG
ncbi:MAG: FAD-dependent pyridine nucleotide-disulfide oxidoreductase [Fibrobacteres bacterium]|nr:FAD-dependent pyridine nucleotide-disulfide oxidoreductase [Fibrobacterota bacterium]